MTTLPAPDPLAHLGAIDLFAELGPAERAAIAAHLELASFPDGAVVVREGEAKREMYVVVEGAARVSRGGLELGAIGRGGHFGELALVAGRPRAASVTAVGALRVARLGLPQFEALTADSPRAALGLVRAMVGRLGAQLTEMTESMGVLLRGRSMPRRLAVRVRVDGTWREVPTGTPVVDVLPAQWQGALVVAGLVDRKPVSLSTPLTSDCEVAPLTTATEEGRRVLRDSAGLLLLEATQRVAARDPELQGLSVSLDHSVGAGQRVAVRGPAVKRSALAERLDAELRVLAGAALALREELWSVEEAREHLAERGWHDAAMLLDVWRAPTVPLVSFGEVYAIRPGPIVGSSALLAGTRVVADGDGLLLVFDPENNGDPATAGSVGEAAARAAAREADQMTREHRRWLGGLQITSVGAFNRACISGEVSQLIRVSEGFQEKRLSQIADAIRARIEPEGGGQPARVVCVAGPSSSGKTTFLKRLRVQLQVLGVNPVGISLDDYYVDREKNPRDEKGELDYEAFEALQVELLRSHLAALLEGRSVRIARYDFQTGRSDPVGGPELRLGDRDLLLLEGIHGLNPRLLATLPPGSVYRVFICPLSQLPFDRLGRVHTSDTRLLRRIVRDRHSRGATAAANILRWPSVRTGERRHIFPFQVHADAVFDSSLIYELSVLKVYAERYLLEVPRASPAATTAARLLSLLEPFVTIYPDHVPPTSILREFIGASGFEG